MICCPMTDVLVDIECLRGLFFLHAVQVVEVEGCQCRFGHNIFVRHCCGIMVSQPGKGEVTGKNC